ncbi:hypothetical protein Tco_1093966 [Tanacetum coccineum]|uniref:Uncharacterized protein n=1 Tax=Tanacetum coccineum TaxID=301880 RepID=A0ABQ5IE80_9ASTR
MLGQLPRELDGVALALPSLASMSPERKAGVVEKNGPSLIASHMGIRPAGPTYAGIQQHCKRSKEEMETSTTRETGLRSFPPISKPMHVHVIARLKKREKQLTKQVNMFMRLFRSDDKFSQMLNQFESQPEYGGGSGSGGCGDDEPGDDEDGGEDEDDS